MPRTRWQTWRMSCEVQIDETTLPAVRFVASFDLNGIPRATVFVPVGRDIQGLQASPVHQLVTQLKQRRPAKLYVSFDKPTSSEGGLPGLGLGSGGKFLVFDGMTLDVSYVKTRGHTEVALQLQHALGGLNDSSCFSDSAHPRNPTHYSYGAIMPGTGSGTRHLTGTTLAADYVDQGKLKEDLWGEALYPFLRSLTDADGIYIEEVGLKGTGKNSGAQAALDLLKPGHGCYKPLGVRVDLDDDLADKIMSDISLSTHSPDQLAAYTLWDLLIGKFSQDYLFSVVPRAKDGLVVPFVGALREKFADITADTYHSVRSHKLSPRVLRAVGILSQISSRLGVVDQSMDGIVPMDTMGVGGWYEGREDGMVMIQSGPRWTGSLLSASRYAVGAAGAAGAIMAADDDPGIGAVLAALPRVQVAARVQQIKSFLDKYAQTIYALESTRGRQAELSGPFRLDIAPGSSVMVEGSGESHIAADQLGMSYFGTVLRVSLYGDAEGQSAGTAMHVGYMRTEAENSDDDTSIAEHPLYNETFSGCALVDGPE